jgi:hypothetical protein
VPPEEWTTPEHVLRYLRRADEYPRRAEGVGLDFFELMPESARKRFADNRAH